MILQGKGAAPGTAVGRIYIYNNIFKRPTESFVPAGKEQSQLDRYLKIKKEAMEELEKLYESMKEHDLEKAKIFKAHQEIVEDVIINEEIPARILNERWTGDWAICQVYETVLGVLRKSTEPMISERAPDFNDVRTLLLRLWYGQKNEGLSSLPDPVIIAAHELMPSDAAGIDRNKVLAILTETGGITSHTAIIAKSYGIPTILSVSGLLDAVKQGQVAAVNADEGTVILNPEKSVADEYIKKSNAFLLYKEETEAFLDKEGITADGVKIDIGLNIANAEDDLKASAYVDSVGVFRTEYLYMGHDTLPAEETQFAVYKKVLDCFGDRPVIIRTLDIGGDKKLSSMALPREENPFLGNRALRFCFTYPEIFTTQIKAALRAAVSGNLWLMLPMVGSMEDIRRAKEHINQAKEELKKEGKPFGEIKTGIMIEIPSVALLADLAAKEVDFASFGSNDLIQYLCAADRMNSTVEDYYQSFHPALFRLMKDTIAAFTKAGKPISICGELGADPKAIPVLIGLGLRKLSMSAAGIAAVKRAVSSVTIAQCEKIADKVLECATAEEVKKYLAGVVSR
jgi:phosphotransferase system enzyme I (PtsI)